MAEEQNQRHYQENGLFVKNAAPGFLLILRRKSRLIMIIFGGWGESAQSVPYLNIVEDIILSVNGDFQENIEKQLKTVA